ncbi:MAG: nucleotidyltransferase domain-containing protein [Bacteroidota bacterium]
MTIDELRNRGLIIYECISGSKAYGLDVPESDTDIKGVFIIPQDDLYGSKYIQQVANESNDIVFYELGRFIDLLKKNNPNALEMLATPQDKIIYKHPFLAALSPSIFLSKKCKDTFGGFAFTQIKKARGLNKKIVNPVSKKRKSILEFCYVLHNPGSLPLSKWLEMNNLNQEQCGLVNIPHFQNTYGMYIDLNDSLGYKGILKKENATDVLLSSIPKGEAPKGYLHFNRNGYMKYCKDYREYWDWVDKRNEARYQNNLEHGKNYDSKNMMHTFRLLDMGIEILRDGIINVKRANRTELLDIRKGKWQYDDLIQQANQKMIALEKAYEKSSLPDSINEEAIETILVDLRKRFYENKIGCD